MVTNKSKRRQTTKRRRTTKKKKTVKKRYNKHTKRRSKNYDKVIGAWDWYGRLTSLFSVI